MRSIWISARNGYGLHFYCVGLYYLVLVVSGVQWISFSQHLSVLMGSGMFLVLGTKIFVVWSWSAWLKICIKFLINYQPADFMPKVLGFWFSPMLVIAGLLGIHVSASCGERNFDEALSRFWGIVMSLVRKFKADEYKFPSESVRDKEEVMHIIDFQWLHLDRHQYLLAHFVGC